MAFHVGQKVVCVDGAPHDRGADRVPNGPALNAIYTIRGISVSGEGVYLEEILNAPAHFSTGYVEPSWWFNRFRPIVERTTDISIFTAMLTDKRESANA